MGAGRGDQSLQKIWAQKFFVPMHWRNFSNYRFEDLTEPPRWLLEIAAEQNLTRQIKILDEGVPMVF